MKVFVLILINKKISFLHVYWSKKLEKKCIKIGNSTQSQQLWTIFSTNLTFFIYNKILQFLHMNKKK